MTRLQQALAITLGLALAVTVAAQPPTIVDIQPPNGASDVDPALRELRVTFDQDMGGGMSWCGGGEHFPETTGPAHWVNARTCVMPVALVPNHTYHLGINCRSYQNFRSRQGVPVTPVDYTFTTAGPGQGRGHSPPRVMRFSPPNGARDVDPAISELRLTFDQEMEGGMSWCGGGPLFPEVLERGHWEDTRTCVLPVRLRPGHTYRLGINCPSAQNFRSRDGRPVESVLYSFQTAGAPDPEQAALLEPPVVVEMTPPNGATDVDPALHDITITFDRPMGAGRSLVGGGEMFPVADEGRQIQWSEDRRTIIWPVRLEPNHHYRFGINSHTYTNFRSAAGVPAEPVWVEFQTGP